MAARPRYPHRGLVTIYECADAQCSQDCFILDQRQTVFNQCMPDPFCPGGSKIYRCVPRSHSVLIQYWTNLNCQGPPSQWNVAFNCEEYQPDAFHRMQCSHIVEPELRQLATEQDKSWMSNTEINIAIAALFIVCFIGVIAGYLLYKLKRKKKSAEKLLLSVRKSSDIEFPALHH